MLKFIGAYIGLEVDSIREEIGVAQVVDAILNPEGLQVVGFYCTVPSQGRELILLSEDIRESTFRSMKIDDSEVLQQPEDLIKYESVLDLNFNLVGKKIVTEDGKKLGKVADYAIDDVSWKVSKLYVNTNLLRDFKNASNVIDRRQIVQVTPKVVVVKSASEKVAQRSRVPAVGR